jgi:hypothetical protein
MPLGRTAVCTSYEPRFPEAPRRRLAATAKGKEVLLYPEQMTSSPLNLHVHGVHVSPKGNSDNVMLHISPGMANTYKYQIPKNLPQGAYWYHSHLHTLTTSQPTTAWPDCWRSGAPTATFRW